MSVTASSSIPQSKTNSSSSKAFVDIGSRTDNGYKFNSSILHNKADEVSKSTGSVYESSRTSGLIHRSSSYDRLESGHEKQTLPVGEYDERCDSNESFLSLVRRFEAGLEGTNNRANPSSILYAKGLDKSLDSLDSKSLDSQSSSTTSSPSLERKRLALKQRNSFKGGTSIFRKLKNTAPELKNVEMELASKDSRLLPRKGFAHFDCQSMIFDFDEILHLRSQHCDGIRPRNTTTGASAARQNAAMATDKSHQRGSGSSNEDAEDVDDVGDGRRNELVLNCPYFRNELGGEEYRQITLSRDSYYQCQTSNSTKYKLSQPGKGKSSLDVLMTAYDSTRRGQTRTVNVSILDNSKEECKEREGNDGKSDDGTKVLFEHVDYGAYCYRDFFVGNEHYNYFGIDERFGPVAVSLRRERVEDGLGPSGEDVTDGSAGSKYHYRVILRSSELQALRGTLLEEAVPSTSRHGTSRGLPPKDILEHVSPELNLSLLRLASSSGPKVIDQLIKLDEQSICQQYKVGLLYCKADQSTEEEMYNNEHSEPSFDEFLDLLGEKVVLKGFEGYRAQLDNRNDSTGEYSLYTKFHGREIMFHVSTLLPHTPNNKQQLLRKRHIGNDIVTIIFQEPGALPFTPKNIRSHFQHVFIIVRVFNPCSDNTYYRVAVSRSKDVPPFGPPIPKGAKFGKQKTFADFLLTKVINAENAAHKSEKFSAMAIRTRFEYLKELCTDHVSNTTLEAGAKFGKFGLSSKKKDKEKNCTFVFSELISRGALTWTVLVEDYRDNSISSCVLGISFDTIVIMDPATKESVFCIHTKAVIGWTPLYRCLKIWYSSGDCVVVNVPEDDSTDIQEIIRRLEIVTKGCQSEEIRLIRNKLGQLGFHVHFEGLVADVEQSGMAWVAGLRQGSRLVEITGVVVATVSHDQMIELLRRPGSVDVTVIPPFSSGKPRKGVLGLRHQPSYSSINSISSVGSASSGEKPTDDEQALGKAKFYIPNSNEENSTTPSFPPASFGKKKVLPPGGKDPWIPLTSSHKSPGSQRRNLIIPPTSTQSTVLSYLVSSTAASSNRVSSMTPPTSYGVAYSLSSASSDTQINSSTSSSSGLARGLSSVSSTEDNSMKTGKGVTVNHKSWSMESIPQDSGRSSGNITPDNTKPLMHAHTEPRTSNPPIAPPRLHRGAKSFRLPSNISPHRRQDPLARSMNEKHSRRSVGNQNPSINIQHPDATIASYPTASGTMYALSQANTFPRTPKKTTPGDFHSLQSKKLQEEERRSIKAKSLGFVESDSRLENVKGKFGELQSGLKVVSGKNQPRVKWYEEADEVQETKVQESKLQEDNTSTEDDIRGDEFVRGGGQRKSYKETTLGPEITTVQKFVKKDNNCEAMIDDTMDQIEKAFGFRTPDKATGSPISRLPTTRLSQRHKRSSIRQIPDSTYVDSENSGTVNDELRETLILSTRTVRSESPRLTDSESKYKQAPSDRSRKSSGSSTLSDVPERDPIRGLVTPSPGNSSLSLSESESLESKGKHSELTFFQINQRESVHDRKYSEPSVRISNMPEISHSKSYSVPDDTKNLKKLTVRTRVNTVNSQANAHTIRESDYIIIENPLKINSSVSSPSDVYSPTETSLTAGMEARSRRRKKHPHDGNPDKSHLQKADFGRSQTYALVSVPISRAPAVEDAPIVSPEKDSMEMLHNNRNDLPVAKRDMAEAQMRSWDKHSEDDNQSTSSSVSEDKMTVKRFVFPGHVVTSSDDSHSEGGVFSPSEHYSSGFAISTSEDSRTVLQQTETLLDSVSQSKNSQFVVEDEALQSLHKASQALEELERLTAGHKTKSRTDNHEKNDKSSRKQQSSRKKGDKKKQKRSRKRVLRRHSFDDRFLVKGMAQSSEIQSSTYSRDTVRKVAELEMQVSILSNDLQNERDEKRRLQKELKQSHEEISKLHEQNRIAASQLRKFTEWLFTSMEQQSK